MGELLCRSERGPQPASPGRVPARRRRDFAESVEPETVHGWHWRRAAHRVLARVSVQDAQDHVLGRMLIGRVILGQVRAADARREALAVCAPNRWHPRRELF
eukprot:6213190-Pleurochrysis_carterae.AAC.1